MGLAGPVWHAVLHVCHQSARYRIGHLPFLYDKHSLHEHQRSVFTVAGNRCLEHGPPRLVRLGGLDKLAGDGANDGPILLSGYSTWDMDTQCTAISKRSGVISIGVRAQHNAKDY